MVIMCSRIHRGHSQSSRNILISYLKKQYLLTEFLLTYEHHHFYFDPFIAISLRAKLLLQILHYHYFNTHAVQTTTVLVCTPLLRQ